MDGSRLTPSSLRVLHVFGAWVIGSALARWGETQEGQGLEGRGWEMGTFRHEKFTMPLRRAAVRADYSIGKSSASDGI